MAALTLSQKATIVVNAIFQSRVKEILIVKANYWKDLTTPSRSDVNIRTQKRNRLAKLILTTNWANNNLALLSEFFLSQYTTSNPDLDENSQPTDQALNDNFDVTYDYFAGVIIGDDSNQNIDW